MGVVADKVRRIGERCAVLARALKHPRTPWYAKAVGALTLLYALSPIDLIPDFIPVLGHLDDIVLVPLGIWATIKLIPREVWMECETPSVLDQARQAVGAAGRYRHGSRQTDEG